MNRSSLKHVLVVCVPVLLATGCASSYKLYGEPLAVDQSKQIAVEKVLAEPTAYDGQTVRLVGNIHEVCQNKGCWITMTDGQQTLRVKFTCPIDGRFVPMEAQGHRGMVEGVLECKEISEAEARHYAEDSGESPEEIAKIQGPQKSLYMRAQGVMIEGADKFGETG